MTKIRWKELEIGLKRTQLARNGRNSVTIWMKMTKNWSKVTEVKSK